jgi:hypothetical protein
MANDRKYTGVISDLRITRSRGVPMAVFTISGGAGKFSMDVMTYGAKNVEKMKASGNGRTLWVQGDFVKTTKKNAVGGTYQEDAFKALNLKDITPEPKAEGEAEAADQSADAGVDAGADTGAEASAAETGADASAGTSDLPQDDAEPELKLEDVCAFPEDDAARANMDDEIPF